MWLGREFGSREWLKGWSFKPTATWRNASNVPWWRAGLKFPLRACRMRALVHVAVIFLCILILVCAQSTQVTESNAPDNILISAAEQTGNSSIEQHGAAIVGNEIEEKKRSLAIFFILSILVVAILVVHLLLVYEVHWIPEALAIVLLGAAIGLILSYTGKDWSEFEALSPDVFFLVLLPPIIFENAYNLNKGYFFSNIWPILGFAILGTAVSTFVIGICVYILGLADLVFKLSLSECFAFAAMVSAVDPVATLAIFQAVKVDGLLYMLVFGESMLNDAVSIVLAATAVRYSRPPFNDLSAAKVFQGAATTFCSMFILSGILGTVIGLLSALLFKHVDLRKTPSLEFALLLVFAYIPYGLAESLSLSGIMAILFCGISMSQYTQQNISPVTQITFRQTFRTIAFVAETSTFAYIGMAFFTIKLNWQPSFVLWSVILCLLGRAANVFPISWLVNRCRREVHISPKNQIIMWFSGMRGAVCFALVLYMDVEKEKKTVILTTTLFIILFTTIFVGGAAMPFISFINKCYPEKMKRRRRTQRRRKSTMLLSKTQEMSVFGSSEWTPRQDTTTSTAGQLMKALFVRKFTATERQENRDKLAALTKRALDDISEDEAVDAPLLPPLA